MVQGFNFSNKILGGLKVSLFQVLLVLVLVALLTFVRPIQHCFLQLGFEASLFGLAIPPIQCCNCICFSLQLIDWSLWSLSCGIIFLAVLVRHSVGIYFIRFSVVAIVPVGVICF